MPLTVNLRKKLHRKIWESVYTPLPAATAVGVCLVKDKLNMGDGNLAYYLTAINTGYQFAANEEGFGQLVASSSGGTFGAGVAAYVHPMGTTGTATAGNTLNITTNLTLARDLRGYRIRITGGTNAGQERLIASNTLGANGVITVQDAFASAIDTTSTYVLMTTRLWYNVQGAGFQYHDFALNTWTSRAVTIVPPVISSNEAIMTGTPGAECLTDIGNVSATVTASTSVPCGTRSWVTNQWSQMLFKVVSGTGVGTYRVVTANTSNTLTLDAVVTLDTTSVFELSGFSAGLGTGGSTQLQLVNSFTTALTVTSASSGTTLSAGNTSGVTVGMPVSGPGIPNNTLITAVSTNVSITLNSTITSATGTTVYVGPIVWGNNIWVGNQVRIVAGTGAGQVRTIANNSANTLFPILPWTVTPDATSYFVIEGNDDQLFVTGGAVVTLYKYSMAGTCAAMSPLTVTSTSSGSTINCSNTSNALVGQYVVGTGIPGGAIITAISLNTSITISGAITAATGTTIQVVGLAHSPAALAITNAQASGITVIACTATAGVTVGMLVSGTGIPTGAIVTAVSANVSFTISAPTTAISAATVNVWSNTFSTITVTTVSTGTAITCGNTSNVVAGQFIAGPGIPSGARVVSVVTNTTINISATITSATGTSVWVWAAGVANNWITNTPTAARGGVAAGGMGTVYLAQVNDTEWSRQYGPRNTTTFRQNGRYLYSWRGGTPLDVYDMATNSWVGSSVLYGGASNESFGAGSSWFELDGYVYVQQSATGKFYRFDASKNEMIPIGTNSNLQGAAVNGNRLYVDKYFDRSNGQSLRILYWAINTGTNLYRLIDI